MGLSHPKTRKSSIVKPLCFSTLLECKDRIKIFDTNEIIYLKDKIKSNCSFILFYQTDFKAVSMDFETANCKSDKDSSSLHVACDFIPSLKHQHMLCM